MNAQLPCIPKRLDHLGLLGQVGIATVFHVAFVGERLKVAAVLDAVRRVDVDHLYLPGHTFFVQQAVHHQQAVARYQPVGPAPVVFVEVHRCAQGHALERGFKQAGLVAAGGRRRFLLSLADGAQNAHGIDAFVHVQAHRIHREAGAFGFARPLQVRRAHTAQAFQGMAHGGGVVTGQGIVDEFFSTCAG